MNKSDETYRQIHDRYPWLFRAIAWLAAVLALGLIVLSVYTYHGFSRRNATIAMLNDSISRAAQDYNVLDGKYRDKVTDEQRAERQQRQWADSIAMQNDSMAVEIAEVYKRVIDFICTPNPSNEKRQDYLNYLTKVLSQGLYNKFIVTDAQGRRTTNTDHISSVLFLGKIQKNEGVLRTTQPIATDDGLFEVENSINGKSYKVQVRMINDRGRHLIDDVKAL